MLRAEGLVRRYGDRTVLAGVNVTAAAGETVAILGPNGAGKTTLLSLLAGLQRPDGGTVGRPAREVGWVPQQSAVYRRLTVRENLALFARLDGVPDASDRVERMLRQADLLDRADERVGRLSGGGQQRVNVAVGLLADPPVVLLDEPSSSLDPRQRERMWRFLGALAAEGRAVVFSTHDVGEAERYADRVIVLVAGASAFDGPPAELAARGGGDLTRAFVALAEAGGVSSDAPPEAGDDSSGAPAVGWGDASDAPAEAGGDASDDRPTAGPHPRVGDDA